MSVRNIWLPNMGYAIGTGIWVLGIAVMVGHTFYNLTPHVYSLAGNSAKAIPNEMFTPLWGFAFVGLQLFAELSYISICVVTGTLLFLQKRENAMVVFMAVAFIALGFGQPNNHSEVSFRNGVLDIQLPFDLVYEIMDATTIIASLLLLYLLPDGRFVPPWTRVASVLWVGMNLIWLLDPFVPFNQVYGFTWDRTPLLSLGVVLAALSTGVYAQVCRWRRTKDEVQRDQIRWIMFGMTLIILGAVFRNIGTSPLQTAPGLRLIRDFVSAMLAIAYPVCLSIAVRRHRLWELNNFISLTLVWSTMTLIVVSIFVIFVQGLGSFLNSPSDPILSAIATAFVAVTFQPLRHRVQRIVDYRIFGARNDPEEWLKQISQRYKTAHAPETLLNDIVQTAAQLLRCPYMAVEVEEGNRRRVVANYGKAPSETHRLALTYQHTHVGYLIVAPRRQGETFVLKDIRLLDSVSGQLAAVMHILQLNLDLQHSREHLVRAAEDERKRLHHELHDAVSNGLFSLAMRIRAANAQLFDDPNRTEDILRGVEEDLVDMRTTVRILINDLRPPELDQLGLLRVTELLAEEMRQADFEVILHLPESLPKLSPAVELAVYRITREAVTNAQRHAQAKRCDVKIEVNSCLEIEIKDDGVGLPENTLSKGGLTSMRERSEYLGGSFEIKPQLGVGTSILVQLPLLLNGGSMDGHN